MRLTPLRIAILAIAGVALAAFVAWKVVLALRSDETRVRLVLEDVEGLARERDGGGVLEYIDPDFRHPNGLDCGSVRRIVAFYFLRAESVEADIDPVSPVRVEGDVATVTVRARVSARLQGQTLTLRNAELRGETFVVTLKRHKSYFRCTGIREAAEGDPGFGGEAGGE